MESGKLIRYAQEAVQEIVIRTHILFSTMTNIQPPNGMKYWENVSNELQAILNEQLRIIKLFFKGLKMIYQKCNETCQDIDYTHMQRLLPLNDDTENQALDERRYTEAYRLMIEENKLLTKQVMLKNKQIKEVITNLRRFIWKINLLLEMRRS